jgi:hypothetical protein
VTSESTSPKSCDGAIKDLTGGCLCGAVRYTARSAGEVTNCHCRMCQRSTGAAFATWVRACLVDSTGQISRFRSSGKVQRGFCPACGSSLMMVYDDEAVVWLAVGSLDTPAAVRPNNNIWTEAMLPFVQSGDNHLPSQQKEN